MKKTINVMLVDDHAVVRYGFRMLLEATEDIRVVAEADSAEAAYQQIPAAKPDVIVMDISLGGTMGVEATRRIVARDKMARVLGLSAGVAAGQFFSSKVGLTGAAPVGESKGMQLQRSIAPSRSSARVDTAPSQAPAIFSTKSSRDGTRDGR